MFLVYIKLKLKHVMNTRSSLFLVNEGEKMFYGYETCEQFYKHFMHVIYGLDKVR